jgi:hypothetical protein
MNTNTKKIYTLTDATQSFLDGLGLFSQFFVITAVIMLEKVPDVMWFVAACAALGIIGWIRRVKVLRSMR